MRPALAALRPYLGTRAFYGGALRVMVPVAVQQLVNTLFNVVDNLMVGSLDINGIAMTAVNVANKPFLIFNGFIFGLTGAGGLMISQFYGARDRKTCQGLFSLQLALCLVAALLFCALLLFIPESLTRLFVSDPRTVALSVEYMRVIAYSYLPAAVSSACIFSLRSLGLNKAPMVVSLLSMGVNALCNYALIFGNFGLPRMGVTGAALGTLIARLFEMAFYLTLLLRGKTYFSLELTAFRRLKPDVARAFFRRAAPLILNEMLWTVGMNLFFWGYARLDEKRLPALTVAELCFQVSAVLAMGTSSAVSILVGAELGANRLDKARENAKKLVSLVVAISLVAVAICIGLANLLPNAYSINDELKRSATALATLLALFAPLNFIYGFCFFCLRAGGDTRNAMLLDSVYMWLTAVPASVLMGIFLPGKLSLMWAVLIVQLLHNAKIVLALYVLKKGKWLRNITA